MTRLAFVLSTGRTGTQFLAQYMAANYSNVMSVHEPPPSYHLRVAANAHMSGRLSAAAMAALLRLSRRKILHALAAELYFESNNFLAGAVDVLDTLAPEVSIIHVVRDPREYVRSALNHGAWTGRKWLASHLVPYWLPDLRPTLRGRRPSPVGIFAAHWVMVNRTLAERGARCHRYFRLRYEDIFDDGNTGLQALCRMVGLPDLGTQVRLSARERVNAGRLRVMEHWPAWTQAQCVELDEICRGWMPEYGYGAEPEWKIKVERG